MTRTRGASSRVQALIRETERLRQLGRLALPSEPGYHGRALSNPQNARFVEFIASEEVEPAPALSDLGGDFNALMSPGGVMVEAGCHGFRITDVSSLRRGHRVARDRN